MLKVRQLLINTKAKKIEWSGDMNVGTMIKDARRAKGLNQQELCEGICTQATISNLESNRTLPNARTLKLIADRLMIDFNELMDLFPNKNGKNEILQSAKVSLRMKDYEKVRKILLKNSNLKKLSNNEVKEYHYYLGMAELLGNNNVPDAMYHFNLGLQVVDNRMDLIGILTLNGIGYAYFMNKESEKAKFYFEKSLIQLEEMRSGDDKFLDLVEFSKIYYHSAKYYSYVKEYDKSNDLLSKGIELQKKEGELPGLEILYFEKGVNFALSNELTAGKKMIFIALGLCEVNSNEILITRILKEAKELGMNSIAYEK